MNWNKRSSLHTIFFVILLLLSLTVSMAQDTIDSTPLVPITTQNVTQLEQWIPLDQNAQVPQEWVPVTRGGMSGIALSPTDNSIAVSSSTGLYFFDTDNLHQEPSHIDGIDMYGAGIFSPDGTKILFRTDPSPVSHIYGKISIYSLTTKRITQLTNRGTTNEYADIQFSADGTRVFAAAYGDRYQIVEWDAETGRRLSATEIPEITEYITRNQPHQRTVPLFVEEDRYLTYHTAVNGSDVTIVVQAWDRETLDEVLRLDLPANTSSISQVEYVAEHGVFVIGRGYEYNYAGAVVWDAITGSRITTILTPGTPYFSSDGATIWFYKRDLPTISVWDIESRQFIHEYDFETEQSICCISTNRMISTGRSGISIWQIDGEIFTKLDTVKAFAGGGLPRFTSDGDKFFIGSGGVEVWDANSWTKERFILVENFIRAIAIAPDNQSFAVAVDDYVSGENLRFYDITTGEMIASATYHDSIYSLAYHPTEGYIAAGRRGAFDVAFYSTQSATMLGSLSEGGVPFSIAFSPDGTFLASGNADTNVYVYNAVTKQSEYVLETGGIPIVEFSHDSTLLAVGTSILTVVDAETGQVIYTSDYLGAEISDMAFSPDDSILATIGSTGFTLWDTTSGHLLVEKEFNSFFPRNRYGQITFHPDGNLLAVGHSNTTLWVVNTGEDSDNDGVDDIRDACPTDAGDMNGCPDSDSDGFIDRLDVCPTEIGTANGCPDEDADGVGNADDICPQEVGSIAANGCPDEDEDGIVDTEDLCPSIAGVNQFMGCPDTDLDNITDADDDCPLYAGSLENNGCPFTGHTNANANIRLSPSTSGSIVLSISPSVEFYIIGRNADGDWLKIVLESDGNSIMAWVFQSLVETDIDTSTLPIQE